MSFVNVETKEQSKKRMHTHHTSRKRLNKLCLPARKLTGTVFWGKKGVLMVEFMQQGTIMSEVSAYEYSYSHSSTTEAFRLVANLTTFITVLISLRARTACDYSASNSNYEVMEGVKT
jgi:hypothetical protein